MRWIFRLKSAKHADKRNERPGKTRGVKQISNFLNKLEELQQTFTASKISQCGVMRIAFTVINVKINVVNKSEDKHCA